MTLDVGFWLYIGALTEAKLICDRLIHAMFMYPCDAVQCTLNKLSMASSTVFCLVIVIGGVILPNGRLKGDEGHGPANCGGGVHPPPRGKYPESQEAMEPQRRQGPPTRAMVARVFRA